MVTVTAPITREEVDRYGETLVRLVTEARTADPARYAGVTSWSTLHDVCDANEFVIEADKALSIDDLDRSVDLFNGAVAKVERALWPSLNGWTPEAEAALVVAYRPVIDYLKRHTGMTFQPTHTGGNVWNLTADLGDGRTVCLQDGDCLRLDYAGEAEACWSALYADGEGDGDETLVMTDLTYDGALFAVAVAMLHTTPDPS